MDQEKIGKLIKEIRIKNNLTQVDFGNKYNVSSQAVSKWENGKNVPDIAILQQISKDFNLNMFDLLNGEVKNKKRNNYLLYIIGIVVALIIIILIILILTHKEDFEFKTIKSNCSNFNITGSLSYNKDKSSIYISRVEYCGGDDNTKYQNIECSLHEETANTVKTISKCNYDKNSNITLEDYLKNVEFIVDNYNSMCKQFDKNNLYIEIKAQEENGKIINYKIPITLKDNCN